MFIPLSLGTLTSLSTGLYFFKKTRLLLSESRTVSDHEHLYIPVLGVTGSGKTLLLASLCKQLTERHKDKALSEEFTAEFFDHIRESVERDHKKLLPFDRDESDLAYQNPGERTTEAMAFFECKQFREGQMNAATRKPEDAVLSVKFATTGRFAGNKVIKLKDIPGEYFEELRDHRANIDPELLKADGLILVVNGVRALEAEDTPLREHEIYRKILDKYLSKPHGPVWVVITMADQLPSHRLDPDWWKDHTLRHIAPELNLKANDTTFEITLVSSNPAAQFAWQALGQAGELFFVHLKEVLKNRFNDFSSLSQQASMHKKWSLSLLISTILLTWVSIGTYQFEHLPQVNRSIWDLNSLKVVKQERIKALKNSESLFNPLYLFKRQLKQDLSLYRGHAWNFVQEKADHWGLTLHDVDQERNSTQELLEALDIASDLSSMEDLVPRSETELDIEKWVKRALDDFKRLPTLSVQELKELEWKARCELVAHRLSGSAFPYACALKKVADQGIRTSREAQLRQATNTQIDPNDQIQVYARLKPILTWETENLDLDSTDTLWSKVNQEKAKVWESCWFQTQKAVNEKNNQPGTLLESLSLLKGFEDQRTQLENEFSRRSLELNSQIRGLWKNRLNSELVKTENERLKLTQKEQAQLDEIIRWAGPYLDPQRGTRIRFKQHIKRWHHVLKEALKDDQPRLFDEALVMIERDLAELDSEEGRDAISKGLKQWRQQLQELKAWRAPSKAVVMRSSDLVCPKDQLHEEGLNDQAKGYLDRYYPYITLTHESIGSSPEGFDRAGDSTYISEKTKLIIDWHPWSTLKIALFEADGNYDADAQADEHNDQLIYQGSSWSVGSSKPKAKVMITPKGGCYIELEIQHQLPQWVIEQGLTSSP